MKRTVVVAICLVSLAVSALAGENAYRVRQGDTLWDLSSRFWKDPWKWPELWALNPHFHNPHVLAPGDPLFLTRGGERGAEVKLPLGTLAPVGSGPEAGSADGRADSTAEASGPGIEVSVARGHGLDFVSSHRIPPVGKLRELSLRKRGYAAGEDLALDLAPEARVAVGDLLTVIDDSKAVFHPVNKEPQGYHVRVLAEAEVRSVEGARAVARLLNTFDALQGEPKAIAYRRPPGAVTPRAAKPEIEGVVIEGVNGRNAFATDDVVFLDRGAIHGLEPGMVLEVPVPEDPRPYQGFVELGKPLARLVVLTVEDKTAAGLVLESRVELGLGDRFCAASGPFSP